MSPVDLEQQLRATFRAVVAQPDAAGGARGAPEAGGDAPRYPAYDRRARANQGVRLAVTLTAVAALLILLAVLLLPGLGSGTRSRRAAEARSAPPPSTVPAGIAGTEEVLEPAVPPSGWVAVGTGPMDCRFGVPEAYTVSGSPTFVVADWGPSSGGFGCGQQDRVDVTYAGNGLGNGTGIDSEPGAAVNLGGTTTSIGVIPDWPVQGQQIYVWGDLPASVAYVTYAYQSGDLTWERPVDGTAAVLVPRPTAYDGDYATWHTAPFPVFTAYTADGTEIGTIEGPRIAGDDMTISPDAPAKP